MCAKLPVLPVSYVPNTCTDSLITAMFGKFEGEDEFEQALTSKLPGVASSSNTIGLKAIHAINKSAGVDFDRVSFEESEQVRLVSTLIRNVVDPQKVKFLTVKELIETLLWKLSKNITVSQVTQEKIHTYIKSFSVYSSKSTMAQLLKNEKIDQTHPEIFNQLTDIILLMHLSNQYEMPIHQIIGLFPEQSKITPRDVFTSFSVFCPREDLEHDLSNFQTKMMRFANELPIYKGRVSDLFISGKISKPKSKVFSGVIEGLYNSLSELQKEIEQLVILLRNVENSQNYDSVMTLFHFVNGLQTRLLSSEKYCDLIETVDSLSEKEFNHLLSCFDLVSHTFLNMAFDSSTMQLPRFMKRMVETLKVLVPEQAHIYAEVEAKTLSEKERLASLPVTVTVPKKRIRKKSKATKTASVAITTLPIAITPVIAPKVEIGMKPSGKIPAKRVTKITVNKSKETSPTSTSPSFGPTAFHSFKSVTAGDLQPIPKVAPTPASLLYAIGDQLSKLAGLERLPFPSELTNVEKTPREMALISQAHSNRCLSLIIEQIEKTSNLEEREALQDYALLLAYRATEQSLNAANFQKDNVKFSAHSISQQAKALWATPPKSPWISNPKYDKYTLYLRYGHDANLKLPVTPETISQDAITATPATAASIAASSLAIAKQKKVAFDEMIIEAFAMQINALKLSSVKVEELSSLESSLKELDEALGSEPKPIKASVTVEKEFEDTFTRSSEFMQKMSASIESEIQEALLETGEPAKFTAHQINSRKDLLDHLNLFCHLFSVIAKSSERRFAMLNMQILLTATHQLIEDIAICKRKTGIRRKESRGKIHSINAHITDFHLNDLLSDEQNRFRYEMNFNSRTNNPHGYCQKIGLKKRSTIMDDWNKLHQIYHTEITDGKGFKPSNITINPLACLKTTCDQIFGITKVLLSRGLDYVRPEPVEPAAATATSSSKTSQPASPPRVKTPPPKKSAYKKRNANKTKLKPKAEGKRHAKATKAAG